MTLEGNQSQQSAFGQRNGSPGSPMGGISPSSLHPVSEHKLLSVCQIQKRIVMSIAAFRGLTRFP